MGTARKTSKTKPASTTKNKKARTSTAKTASAAKKRPATRTSNGSPAIIERRAGQDRRKTSDRRTKDEPVAAERRKVQRRAKVNRRRQIDPTTCERDYTPDEIEFMNALDDYKRVSGRMFPTCSEILEVIRKLGYAKHPLEAPAQAAPESPTGGPASQTSPAAAL